MGEYIYIYLNVSNLGESTSIRRSLSLHKRLFLFASSTDRVGRRVQEKFQRACLECRGRALHPRLSSFIHLERASNVPFFKKSFPPKKRNIPINLLLHPLPPPSIDLQNGDFYLVRKGMGWKNRI